MKIGDKEYSPRFPIMSCIALEGALNTSVIDIVGEIQKPKKTPPFGFMLAVTWAGMLHESPALTIEDVAAILDGGEQGDLSEAYAESVKSLIVSTAQLLIAPKKAADTEEDDPKN